MSGSLRDQLRAIRRRAGSSGPDAEHPLPSPALLVVAQIPANAQIDQLTEGLHALLERRLHALELRRPVVVRVEPTGAAGSRAAVAIDGRPLAIVDVAPHSPSWVADAIGAVDLVLLRRLSILLTPADDLQYARDLEQAWPGVGSHPQVAGYLLDNGIALRKPPPPPDGVALCRSAAEAGELLIDALAADTIDVQVAEAMLRSTTGPAKDTLVEARAGLYAQLGLQYPDVRLMPSDAPPPGAVRIRCNDVELPDQPLPAGSGWPDVGRVIEATLRAQAPWFLRLSDVHESRSRTALVSPDLAGLSRAIYSDALLSACLRELLRGGDSIRNLPRILWLLIEAGSAGLDRDMVRLSEIPLLSGSDAESLGWREPELIASSLRKRIADEAWRAGLGGDDPHAVSLPADLEERLLRPYHDGERADAEWQAVRAVDQLDEPLVVAHSPQAVRPIRYALAACRRPPRVIASQELPPDVPLPPIITLPPIIAAVRA